MVKVKYIPSGNVHTDTKFVVLEGSVEGYPEVTKTRSINTAALVDGTVTLAGEKAILIAAVEEYLARWLKTQKQLKEL